MFLIRLLHIKSIKMKIIKITAIFILNLMNKISQIIKKKRDPINQIKNVVQEKSLENVDLDKNINKEYINKKP